MNKEELRLKMLTEWVITIIIFGAGVFVGYLICA